MDPFLSSSFAAEGRGHHSIYWWLSTFRCRGIYMLEWWQNARQALHGDVIKWKHFPRYWPVVRGSPRTQVSDAELWWFLLSASWIYGWVNNREAGDFRRHCAHYDVIVMLSANQSVLICATAALSVLSHWGRATHMFVSDRGYHRYR